MYEGLLNIRVRAAPSVRWVHTSLVALLAVRATPSADRSREALIVTTHKSREVVALACILVGQPLGWIAGVGHMSVVRVNSRRSIVPVDCVCMCAHP